MTSYCSLALVPLHAPLDPSPDRARSLLRTELLHPPYHQQNLIDAFMRWLNDRLSSTLQAASNAPPLGALASIVVFAILVVLVVWLLSRFRRTPRVAGEGGAVLTNEVVTAAQLRARAEAALAGGHHAEALVDGFRALTVRQIERGRLDDLPGATAHEVAAGLGSTFPQQGPRVRASADLFDLVLYGDRPAGPDQAAGVLALDDELARA
ncbi:MAG: integral rane protein [Marmoricola sp.]|nr:integral rane protein [Marmoricola sp.]